MSGRPDHRLLGAYERLGRAEDIVDAASHVRAIGVILGLDFPAVADDYSHRTLLRAQDGRAIATLFGWEEHFQSDWEQHRLHRVSPIGAVCRMTTRPFTWSAAAMAALAQELAGRSARGWHLTPERGIVGGITVPVHMPRCITGSVSWTTRDETVDLEAVLRRHEDLLRLAAHRFMDLIYAAREDAEPEQLTASLSEREIECLTWVALGRTDAEIAEIIHRSATTARFHVENAVAKLGARNRTQAVGIACQLGLIQAID